MREECGKRVRYIYNFEKNLVGCFRIEGNRGDGNETGLKRREES